jgi:predicted lipoprotein with Yx(FWY)xxD motif
MRQVVSHPHVPPGLALTAAVAVAVAVAASLSVSAPAAPQMAPIKLTAAVVKLAFNEKLKKTIVVDVRGRTLYEFAYDTDGTANCAAEDSRCPKLWPALATTAKPVAGKGINAKLLGTTKGAGGVKQVTYNRHPLYYFAGGFGYVGDKKPGDVKGQAFFNVWYVLSPKGAPIR